MVNAESMQGQPAPSFNLQDQNGDIHQLIDYSGQWLVIYFYPKDDTTGCTIEATAFRDNYQLLKSMNAEVIGVSLDDAESHLKFIKKHSLPFNLLVDDNKVMSKAYGVDGGLAFFKYAKRQTFIISPEGNIAKHFQEVDPNTHVKEVLDALELLNPQTNKNDAVSLDQYMAQDTDEFTVYGAPWHDADTGISIDQALREPNEYLGQKKQFNGRVTKVCQKQGCWMILAEGDLFARVDFNDHAFLIPKDTSGRAEVYGQLVEKQLSADEVAHYESEGAENLTNRSFEIVAEAVKIIK